MKSKAVILVVDDVASNVQTLASLLKNDYQIKVATDGKRAIELTKKEPIPDLILLDVEMPDMSGYDVLKTLKNIDISKDIPIIFVTSNNTVHNEEEGLLLGAVDYITKPISSAIVKVRVQTHITIKQQRDKLFSMAKRDQLTSLYNRHYLTEDGARKFSRAKRQKTLLSIVMIDIDHFKSINDNYGHLVGDNILKAVSATLNKSCRKEDIVVRYGGEEFIIVFEDSDIETTTNKAEIIRKNIEKLVPYGIKTTISSGVAEITEKHNSFEDLLKDADDALYVAKQTGRNRVVSN